MKKKELRDFFRKLLKRLTKGWNLLVTGAWSAIIWLSAVANNHVGELLFIIFITILGFGMLYFISRGR